MQRHATIGRTLIASALACGLAGVLASAADPKSYGKGVAIAKATPLTTVLASPATFEGKRVRVEGYVTSVCEEMGCWLALAPSPGAEASLLVQVEHGVVIFPMSARGSKAAAEGVLERIGGSAATGGHGAEHGEHRQHGDHGDHGGHAGDHGKEAAAEHAKAQGKSPAAAAQWHLMATGALIYN